MRPRILLLIPHLGGGGAEQVTALWARSLSAEKYEVHLGLITQFDAGPEVLPASVSVHGLGATRVRAGAWRLLRLVRRLRPDVILSGMAHLNFLVLLLRPVFPSGTFVLTRQNSTVSAALQSGDLPSYTRLLYRLLYRRADRIICQSQAMAADLIAEIGISPARLAVIPNPVDVDAIRVMATASENHWTGAGPHLIAIGRLAPEKGFDLLLQALAGIREQYPEADLVIAGTGPLESVLKAQSAELGLATAVRFVGHVSPAQFFPGATAFVLSSRHEGLPNALLEAAAAGLPLVALPSSQSVVDLLRGQPGTWLGGEISAPALTGALRSALEVLRPQQRFEHRFIEPFRLDRSTHALENLIDSTLSEARP